LYSGVPAIRSHFDEAFVRQRDPLVLTWMVDHLISDTALAGLRPMLIRTWAVR